VDNKYRVLTSMDNPMRVFVWNIDQVLVALVPLLVGILLSSVLVMLSGILFGFIYSRLRCSSNRGDLVSLLYWHLPSRALKKRGFFVHLPDSHERDLIL